MTKIKIALITPSLAKGGLEKVVVEAANVLKKEYDITLIVMDNFRTDYPYDGKVLRLDIGLENRGLFSRAFNLFMGMWKLRKLKKEHRFDLVISHGELASLPNILSGGSKNIVVVHENRFAALKDLQGKMVNRIIKYLYSFKSVYKVVTVSEGIRESFIEILELAPDKILSIYNPYDIDEIKNLSTEKLELYSSLFEYPVLTMTGRLTMQKGQWYLIRVFKALKKTNPDLKLLILGIGEMKDELIGLSENLGFKTYDLESEKQYDDSFDVYFLGFQSNPFKFVKSSRLFAMTSLWEGFGNTIVEAMACAVPVISSDCPSGPGEIICPEVKKKGSVLSGANYDGSGVLMPVFENVFVGAEVPLSKSEVLWVDTLHDLLNNDEQLADYAQKGLVRAEDFRTEVIMLEWKKLIDEVLLERK